MNNYKVTFNYHGEISTMNTEADTNYNAILKCLPVMAKKYGVTRDSMIRYFTADKQNRAAEVIEIGYEEQKKLTA
jgi:hypothetical protein